MQEKLLHASHWTRWASCSIRFDEGLHHGSHVLQRHRSLAGPWEVRKLPSFHTPSPTLHWVAYMIPALAVALGISIRCVCPLLAPDGSTHRLNTAHPEPLLTLSQCILVLILVVSLACCRVLFPLGQKLPERTRCSVRGLPSIQVSNSLSFLSLHTTSTRQVDTLEMMAGAGGKSA